jgi:hypothetical protein
MVVSKFPKCEAYGLNTLADLEASKVEQALSELAVSNDARKDIIEMQKERIAQLEHEVKYSHQMEDLLRDDYKKCELELKTAESKGAKAERERIRKRIAEVWGMCNATHANNCFRCWLKAELMK